MNGRKLLIPALLAALPLAACSSAPRYRSSPPDAVSSTTTPEVPSERQDIVQLATSFIGTPYRTGGASRQGMDCSGLVMRVYREFNVDLPRTSIDQSHVGSTVARSEIEPGDLLFFKTSSRRPVSHVGIYIGRGRFVHASTSARRVRVDLLDSDYFSHRFVVAKRVLDF
jgi:cell wall-associated NlpC family hydrolase